ncbi:hypothetical protein NHX12_010052 [Muraenolepis orangiensis]|uniref:Uncharacterized protein n=1 Tax=Muraenolepis orangiensis TaxID=630683 RepID=A0A9Q0DLH3_9TELE|nr:hypothetical protein NHX12_010052 [Muraenolepis orangiensis]
MSESSWVLVFPSGSRSSRLVQGKQNQSQAGPRSPEDTDRHGPHPLMITEHCWLLSACHGVTGSEAYKQEDNDLPDAEEQPPGLQEH